MSPKAAGCKTNESLPFKFPVGAHIRVRFNLKYHPEEWAEVSGTVQRHKKFGYSILCHTNNLLVYLPKEKVEAGGSLVIPMPNSLANWAKTVLKRP
nr:hypothetical protein BdHM001_36220 [Bdellovibrio sp. HM001]